MKYTLRRTETIFTLLFIIIIIQAYLFQRFKFAALTVPVRVKVRSISSLR